MYNLKLFFYIQKLIRNGQGDGYRVSGRRLCFSICALNIQGNIEGVDIGSGAESKALGDLSCVRDLHLYGIGKSVAHICCCKNRARAVFK